MAAMALALNIQLSKPGVYTLNMSGRAPEASDIDKSIKFSSKSTIAGVSIYFFAIFCIAIWRQT
jgi:adenosylcobinamide-phosphate synthase